MVESEGRIIAVKEPLDSSSSSVSKFQKSWKPYNALKLPVLKFFRGMGGKGASKRDLAVALSINEDDAKGAVLRYFKWGWLMRWNPPTRPGTKRKRGRPKYVYGITEKGLHELRLLEQLDAAGLPLKPREFKLPAEGRLGGG